MKMSISDHMDVCEEVMLKARIMARRTLPLHRQAKNLYKLNRALQTEVRVLKEENKMLDEELQINKYKLSKRNFKILAEAAASR